MDESQEFVRLELDGRWSAEEVGRALICLSELYNLRLFLELLREEARVGRVHFNPPSRAGAAG